MNLDDKFNLIEQFQDHSLRTANFFMEYIEKELRKVVSSTKELTIEKEDIKIGKTVNITYRNVDSDGGGVDNVAFEIVVSGFGKNGKTDGQGIMVTFEYTQKDPDLKPLARKKGKPYEIVKYIKDYFVKNAEVLTRYEDIVGSEEFQDVDENGTSTGDIAVHGKPIGSVDDQRKKKLAKRIL